jgi:hypothetical protein
MNLLRTFADTVTRVAPLAALMACGDASRELDRCIEETQERMADISMHMGPLSGGCVELEFTSDDPELVDFYESGDITITCFVVDGDNKVWNTDLVYDGENTSVCGLNEGDEYGLYCATVDLKTGECDEEIKID